MKKRAETLRLSTGVKNLDALLHGGIPRGAATIIGGTPGAGKTTLVQQICFQNASPTSRVLYFNTLSEPTAKSLRYMSQFAFFDRRKLEESIQFTDLGVILRNEGLDEVGRLVMDELKKVRPAIVVIDSFKVFDDLSGSREELRKFGYEMAVNLMAWDTTAFLLGEYGPGDIQNNPLFSIVDGLLLLTQRRHEGEPQRLLQVVKMRGTDHSRDEHAFVISGRGIEIFAPRLTIRREDRGPTGVRCKTGISRLDDLLGEGIPRGSSLLIAGVAGTGKTVLLLEFVYRGAQAGEKGIVFSFEETEERLLASAHGLGWDLQGEIDRGMVEIHFIPQPDITVEADLLMMRDRIERLGARRVVVDSISVFLHKLRDPEAARERTFQIASLVQNAEAVGFLATDIPYGTEQISRFGVEETVVDGVIVLSSTTEGLERQRYLEVYKLRNTAHLKGRHDMLIGEGGISVYPRYDSGDVRVPDRTLEPRRRLTTGVPGLDPLLAGGLLERSITFVTGSAGIGKSTIGIQFALEGVRKREPALFVTLEENSAQLRATAESIELPLDPAIEGGLLELVHIGRPRIRPGEMLAVLTDRIRARGVKRLVLDGASSLVKDVIVAKELRQLLDTIAIRFKGLGVTMLLTFETADLQGRKSVTERGVSPVADNLIMLRYRESAAGLLPTVTVVKTRGSAHDFGTHALALGVGGVRVVPQAEARTPKTRPKPTRKKKRAAR